MQAIPSHCSRKTKEYRLMNELDGANNVSISMLFSLDEIGRANNVRLLNYLNATDPDVRFRLALVWHVVFTDIDFLNDVAAVFESIDADCFYKTRAVCMQAPEFSPPALSYLF